MTRVDPGSLQYYAFPHWLVENYRNAWSGIIWTLPESIIEYSVLNVVS